MGAFSPELADRDTTKEAQRMKDRESNLGFDLARAFEMKCHRCGQELPLLHPHIVVERYDDEDNMICESCFMNGSSGDE